jgi:hypothetical protein
MDENDASRLLIFIGMKSGRVARMLDSSKTVDRRDSVLVTEDEGEGGYSVVII